MSLCVILMDNKEILMSADTRESITSDGKIFARYGNINKIAIIHDKVIFGSGNKSLIQAVWDAFNSQNDSSIEKLQEIAIKHEQEFVDTVGIENIEKKYIQPDGKMTLCITVATMEEGLPVLYHINSYKNFEIEKTLPTSNNIRVNVSGTKCREAYDYIINNSKEGTNIINLLYETYEKLAFEGIGGMMQIYKIDRDGIRLNMQKKIIDKRCIRYEKPKYIEDIHCVATNANIQGEISASNITGSTIKGGKINGTIIDGATINGGNINVSTDVKVGNNLYLGSLSSNNIKSIYFNNSANISNYKDWSGNPPTGIKINASTTNINGDELEISALNTYFYNNVNFDGNVYGLDNQFASYNHSHSEYASDDHTHDTRYIRPYYPVNRCYLDFDYESGTQITVRDKQGKVIGYVDVSPA